MPTLSIRKVTRNKPEIAKLEWNGDKWVAVYGNAADALLEYKNRKLDVTPSSEDWGEQVVKLLRSTYISFVLEGEIKGGPGSGHHGH